MGLSVRVVPNPAREVFATLTEERKDYVFSIPKFGTGEAAFSAGPNFRVNPLLPRPAFVKVFLVS